MKRLLSICIPTYNRAEALGRQLAWLAKEIQGFEAECEIIVSDNCSTDTTPDVVEQWRAAFSQTQFHFNRNQKNIGWIRNFAYCLQTAIAPHTWIIGDDDIVYDGTLAYVLKTLKASSDLSLLYLNYLGRNAKTGEVIGEHWFDPQLQNSALDGKTIFQQCIEANFGSVIFITAIVFQTELARSAIQQWSSSLDNWGGVATWAGFCAAQGRVLVTQENHLECVIGVSHWQNESRIHFKTRYHDTPEVYVQLREMGYSPSFCRRMIWKIWQEDFTSIKFLRSFVGSLLVKPIWAVQVVGYFLATTIAMLTHKDQPEIHPAQDFANLPPNLQNVVAK